MCISTPAQCKTIYLPSDASAGMRNCNTKIRQSQALVVQVNHHRAPTVSGNLVLVWKRVNWSEKSSISYSLAGIRRARLWNVQWAWPRCAAAAVDCALRHFSPVTVCWCCSQCWLCSGGRALPARTRAHRSLRSDWTAERSVSRATPALLNEHKSTGGGIFLITKRKGEKNRRKKCHRESKTRYEDKWTGKKHRE